MREAQSRNPSHSASHRLPAMRQALVFLTHVWHESVGRRFERLRREAGSLAECHVLLDDRAPAAVEGWRNFLSGIRAAETLVPFSPRELPGQLGFPFFGIRGIWSNPHFPLMAFARTRPQYDFFWQVEYDVEYRGRWGDFLGAYAATDAALLAAHFHRYADWPEWFWWPSLTVPAESGVKQDDLYKAFMPVMRLSRAAVASVERAHRQGWLGHFEAIVPTVLLREGHTLEDLNVRLRCYEGSYQDPIPLLPLQSTMRCRPPVGAAEFAQRGKGPLLFHPVKEPWFFDGERVVSP